MKRAGVLLLAALLPLGWASAAQADAPLREVIEFVDVFETDACGFPVEYRTDAKIIRTTYTDSDGAITRIREVYPRYRVTLTNLDTGEVLEINSPGPAFYTFDEDGTVTLVGTGPWIFGPIDPVGLILIKGRFEQVTYPDGTTEFTRVGGPEVDLCAKLAA